MNPAVIQRIMAILALRNANPKPQMVSPEGGQQQAPRQMANAQQQMGNAWQRVRRAVMPPVRAAQPQQPQPQQGGAWDMKQRNFGQYYKDVQNFQNSPDFQRATGQGGQQ